MVDISEKPPTSREAVARGSIRISKEAMKLVREGRSKKGNVVETARLAGILAAKRTSDLIPLCHPLALDHVNVTLSESESGFDIEARVRSRGPTGVEMEALTAVAVCALTVYDMVKAADKTMVIENIRVIQKKGGRSGDYVRQEPEEGQRARPPSHGFGGPRRSPTRLRAKRYGEVPPKPKGRRRKGGGGRARPPRARSAGSERPEEGREQ
jgi:cyclic pyranopterin phosphate synthase